MLDLIKRLIISADLNIRAVKDTACVCVCVSEHLVVKHLNKRGNTKMAKDSRTVTHSINVCVCGTDRFH